MYSCNIRNWSIHKSFRKITDSKDPVQYLELAKIIFHLPSLAHTEISLHHEIMSRRKVSYKNVSHVASGKRSILLCHFSPQYMITHFIQFLANPRGEGRALRTVVLPTCLHASSHKPDAHTHCFIYRTNNERQPTWLSGAVHIIHLTATLHSLISGEFDS